MLIPQYSLRWLLAEVTALAFVFLIFSLAARGHIWAMAISLAFMSLAILVLLDGLLFWIAWMFATYVQFRKRSGPPAPPETQS